MIFIHFIHNFNFFCLFLGLNTIFSKLEILAVLIAALAHDVGHPGVNNVYLIKAKNELALRHNDRSPLENMHCSVLYDILNKKESNILGNIELNEIK